MLEFVDGLSNQLDAVFDRRVHLVRLGQLQALYVLVAQPVQQLLLPLDEVLYLRGFFDEVNAVVLAILPLALLDANLIALPMAVKPLVHQSEQTPVILGGVAANLDQRENLEDVLIECCGCIIRKPSELLLESGEVLVRVLR